MDPAFVAAFIAFLVLMDLERHVLHSLPRGVADIIQGLAVVITTWIIVRWRAVPPPRSAFLGAPDENRRRVDRIVVVTLGALTAGLFGIRSLLRFGAVRDLGASAAAVDLALIGTLLAAIAWMTVLRSPSGEA